MSKARKLTLVRLVREVKAVKAVIHPEPQVYTDGHGELCSTLHPAQYSWVGVPQVWGKVA